MARLFSDSSAMRLDTLEEIVWGGIRKEDAVETLKKLIPPEPKTARERMEMPGVQMWRVLRALTEVGDEEALIEACRIGLSWKDWDVREAAAGALGSLGARGGPVVSDLIPLLGQEKQVANTAARALGDIGPAAREAVPKLVELLRERNTLRDAPGLHNYIDTTDGKWRNPGIGALSALRKIGVSNEEVLAALREASTDENDGVREEAQRALRALK